MGRLHARALLLVCAWLLVGCGDDDDLRDRADGRAPDAHVSVDGAVAADAPADTPATHDLRADALAAGDTAAGDTSDARACPAGFHACGNTCMSDDDVNACGKSCEPCPTVRKGMAVCDGVRCGIRCPPKTKTCRDECILETSVCEETCGMVPALPVTCGRRCVADTPDSCCSLDACGAYGCKNNRCLTTCQSHADCADSFTCDTATGQCGPCGQLGQPCCWDTTRNDYVCAPDDVFCDGALTCVRP
jgi:hypothetical protein